MLNTTSPTELPSAPIEVPRKIVPSSGPELQVFSTPIPLNRLRIGKKLERPGIVPDSSLYFKSQKARWRLSPSRFRIIWFVSSMMASPVAPLACSSIPTTVGTPRSPLRSSILTTHEKLTLQEPDVEYICQGEWINPAYSTQSRCHCPRTISLIHETCDSQNFQRARSG